MLERPNLKIKIKNKIRGGVKDQRQRHTYTLACGGSRYALVAHATSYSIKPSPSLVSLDASQQTHFDDAACGCVASVWR